MSLESSWSFLQNHILQRMGAHAGRWQAARMLFHLALQEQTPELLELTAAVKVAANLSLLNDRLIELYARFDYEQWLYDDATKPKEPIPTSDYDPRGFQFGMARQGVELYFVASQLENFKELYMSDWKIGLAHVLTRIRPLDYEHVVSAVQSVDHALDEARPRAALLADPVFAEDAPPRRWIELIYDMDELLESRT